MCKSQGQPSGWLSRQPRRIALLHLESLCCLPALEILFAGVGNRIGLVVVSRRFGSHRGSFWKQTRHWVASHGLPFSVALGLDLILPRVTRSVGRVLQIAARSRVRLRTVRELAERHGAQYLETLNVNSAEAAATLAEYQPDLVISLHFDQILRRPLIDAIAAPIVNLHPSLLPGHRGPCPSFWCLEAGQMSTGATIHRIVDGSVDTGDQLAWAEIAMPRYTSMKELDGTLFAVGAHQLIEMLRTGCAFCPRDLSKTTESYRSFPSAAVVRAARRRGVRLWRLRHAVALVAAGLGLRRWHEPAWTMIAASARRISEAQSS